MLQAITLSISAVHDKRISSVRKRVVCVCSALPNPLRKAR